MHVQQTVTARPYAHARLPVMCSGVWRRMGGRGTCGTAWHCVTLRGTSIIMYLEAFTNSLVAEPRKGLRNGRGIFQHPKLWDESACNSLSLSSTVHVLPILMCLWNVVLNPCCRAMFKKVELFHTFPSLSASFSLLGSKHFWIWCNMSASHHNCHFAQDPPAHTFLFAKIRWMYLFHICSGNIGNKVPFQGSLYGLIQFALLTIFFLLLLAEKR